MKKNAMITLKSVQSVDAQRNETELITAGNFTITPESAIISYDETEATGFDGARTILTCIGDNYATMERLGNAQSHLIIEKNKKHHCHYGTPFGEFIVGIYTHAIENRLHSNGGDVYLKYTIDVNSSYVADNEIYINIKMDKN